MTQLDSRVDSRGAGDVQEDSHVDLLLAMSSEPDGGAGDDLDRVLALASDFFELDFGIVSRVRGDSYEVERVHQPSDAGLMPGQRFELGQTYCAITLEASDVVSIEEMRSSSHSGHPCYACFGLESYLGVPLIVEGETYGTLNFSRAAPRARAWTETDRQLVRLVARWVESSISQQRLRSRLSSALEQLDKSNQKLELRNQDLNNFAHVASHDLQAPLRKLVGLSKLLSMDLGSEMPEQASEDLELLQKEAQRMQSLVHDLLEFCRTGSATIDELDVELDGCATAAIDALQSTIEEVQPEIVRGPLPTVRGQATLLTQVFQNLIGNAVKFRRPDETPRIEIRGEREGDVATVTVTDNGIGIDPGYAEQVFAPFQRLHGGDKYEGAGLGLAICRNILSRHGGSIRVEPAEGGGSMFTLTLDCTLHAASAA